MEGKKMNDEKYGKFKPLTFILGAIIGLLLGVSVMALTGCEDVEPSGIASVMVEYSDFDLTFDYKTKIVYIDNRIHTYSGYENHIYTPYYSENGKLCKFDDGEIVELE